MRRLLFLTLILSLLSSSAFAQGLNKVVFGPLEGDDAGVLAVHNGQDIEIEMWVRTDPDNPMPVIGLIHGLLSDDAIIAIRNGAEINPEYDMPNWEWIWIDGPFIHNPNDDYPIPVGYTCEMVFAIYSILGYPPPGDPLDTEGEWEYYGAFLMTCNTGVPIEETYYPFSMGWYPSSGRGTEWLWEDGGVIPEQSYCGLYFETGFCDYIPGDVNHNGAPMELIDVIAMLANYRGSAEPDYTCTCTEDPPFYDFPATADPNGNCTPNELNDVVMEIGAYRGETTPSGCPDCPGSEGLLLRENKQR
jgi:hypothetical protein